MKNILHTLFIGLSIHTMSSIQAMRAPEKSSSSFPFIIKSSLIGGLTLAGIVLYYKKYYDPKSTIAEPKAALEVINLQAEQDSMLLEAIKKGDVAAVRDALQNKANPNAVTEHGSNMLIQAALRKGPQYTEITKILLQKGALVSTKNKEGMNAFMIACKYNDTTKAELLFDFRKKEDIHATNNQGETALMLAAWHGNSELISHLVLAGANINKGNKYGETPLIYFLENPRAHEDGLKQLLLFGASTDICDRYKNTALSLAIQNHNYSVTRSIIQHQAPAALRTVDILLKNRDGFTMVDEARFKEEKMPEHLFLIKNFLVLEEQKGRLKKA